MPHHLFLSLGKTLVLILSVLILCPHNTFAQHDAKRLSRAKTLFVNGQQAYLDGKLKEALQMFYEAHYLVPSAELAYNIGHISEQLGDLESAVRFLRLYLSRKKHPAKDYQEVEQRLNQLQKMIGKKNQQLITSSSQLIDSARSYFKLGVQMFQQGRYQVALVSFKIAQQRQQLPEITYNIALSFERLGQKHEAVQYYRAYLKTVGHEIKQKETAKKINGLLKKVSKKLHQPSYLVPASN